MLQNPIARTFFVLLCVALLSRCGARPEGWGVLLWSHDEQELSTGAVIGIYDTSSLRQTYTVRAGNDDNMIEIDQWRVEFFKNKREAEAFQTEYQPYKDLYGAARLDSLRVRAKESRDAGQVYKLREGEIVKIVDRNDTPVTIGGYEGYWYGVLTSTGVSGFTFGEYLQVDTLDALKSADQIEERDEFLELFLNSNFRPAYYRDMARSGRIDLERFTPEYGVFPDPENSKIVVVNEEHTSTLEYEAISRPTNDSYAFEGSTLILTRVTTNRVNFIYTDDGVRYDEDYVYFPRDIDMIVIQEQERRDALLERFVAQGATLVSSAYGNIAMTSDGSFTWEGYERIVPDILSARTESEGTVDFPLHLDEPVRSDYDGAISFTFASTPEEETIHFLYRFQNDGVQLTYLPEQMVDGNLVVGDGNSPVIIYFQYSS